MENMKPSSIIPPKQRDSNLELYRIVLMLAIIAHHYVVNSGILDELQRVSSANGIFLLLFGAWGKTCINCFVFITGYFMCKSEITVTKFLKLFLEIMFYRIVIGVIFIVTGYTPITGRLVLELFMPLNSLTENFAGCFLIFFLCIPFLNILIHNVQKNQHFYLLVLLLIFYTVLPSTPYLKFNTKFNYVTWFSIIYLIASYCRLYPFQFLSNRKILYFGTVLTLFISAISVIILFRAKGISHAYFFIADSNKILALVNAIFLFYLFKNIPLKYTPWINYTSRTIFGVLLIHAQSDAMRKWLWHDVCANTEVVIRGGVIPHAIGVVIGVFIVCSLLDNLRIHFLEAPLFAFIKRKNILSRCKLLFQERRG